MTGKIGMIIDKHEHDLAKKVGIFIVDHINKIMCLFHHVTIIIVIDDGCIIYND